MLGAAAEVLKPGTPPPELPKDAGYDTVNRLFQLLEQPGSIPVAQLRRQLQKAMQTDAAVFRTQVPPSPRGRNAVS